jgi:hypothetical protein
MEFEAMAPTSSERRIFPENSDQQAKALENGADQRWEGEGGAISPTPDLAPRDRGPAHPDDEPPEKPL